MAFPIDFWFSIGSLYTYSRGDAAPRGRGPNRRGLPVAAVQRPHHHDRDGQHPGQEAGEARLFVARRGTAGRGIRVSISFASALPAQNSDLANRIATVGAAEGWCPDYVRAAYRRWFLDHEQAGSERSNADCLHAIGQNARRVLERAAARRPPRRTRPPPPKRAASAFSACRHSSAAARSSGATTGWTMRSVGTKSGIEPRNN